MEIISEIGDFPQSQTRSACIAEVAAFEHELTSMDVLKGMAFISCPSQRHDESDRK